jgi:tetratricopeptide (TPR) repeat protein
VDHHRILEKAIALQQSGRGEEALQVFDAVLGKTIDEGYVLYCAGTGYLCEGFNGVAMTLLSQAVQNANPDDKWLPAAWNNLASALKKEGHTDLAVKAFHSSIGIKQDAGTIGNLSGMYINQGQPDKALEWAKKALAIDPYQPQAGNHYALALLERGDYEEGFRWYNSRLRLPEFHNRHYDGPMWNGEYVDTLIIHGEQGVGDELMFASLINEAKSRVGKVVIECATKLVKTFERSFQVPCFPDDKSLKEKIKADAWVAMGSLPSILKVHSPLDHSGYMKPDPERVEFWKNEYPFPRIGISWRGGTKMTHWMYRNFDAKIWMKLTSERKMISLQYGEWGNEINRLGLYSPNLSDFDDHMALVKACDLVISVCNSTVHMAGSMDVPCWCLVPSRPAWRYGIKGDRMLWYPSVKMFRQIGDDWESVIEKLRSELKDADFSKIQRTEFDDAQGKTVLRNDGRSIRLAYSQAR